MSLQMSVNQLAESQELLQLIEEMKKKGLLPGLTDTKQLAHDVAQSLHNDQNLNFTKNDLTDPQMKNVLQIAIMGQHLNSKGFDFNYKLLFKAPTPENQELLKEELVKLLKEKLMEAAKKDPALKAKLEQNPEKVDQILRMAVDRMMKNDLSKYNDKDFTFQSNAQLLMKVMDALDMIARSEFRIPQPGKEHDQVKEDLETRYNFDIRGGGEARPVFVITAGRELGQLDLDNNPTSYSFSGRENTPDYGRYDPNGTVWSTILNFLSANMDGALEYELNSANKLPGEQAESSFNPSPFKTTPKPPGTEV